MTPIPDILDELRAGRMVVLTDDERRENEGDLVVAAQFATPANINFMLREGRGMMCVALSGALCDRLDLEPQSRHNTSLRSTAYTISVDAAPRFGVTTGVSAADRATTIKLLADDATRPADLARPGHTQPLRARDGGTLVRAGQTEGSVDLCRMAGLTPAAVIIEVMNDDGTMARLPDLVAFAQRHNIKIGTISDLIAYRRRHDNLVRVRDEQTVTSGFGGEWTLRVYTDETQGAEHIALIKGDISGDAPVLVRMHAMDPLLDVAGLGGKGRTTEFGRAMEMIAEEGRGVVVLLRDTTMKLASGDAASPQTLRQYGLGAQILSSLGLSQLVLMTNSPTPRVVGLDAYGLSIVGTRKIPLD